MSVDAEQNQPAFELRPSVVIFLGRDTHPIEEKYVPFLGSAEPLQRILKLSASDPVEAWDEDLSAAMDLFTAANFEALARQGMPIQDVIRGIPVLIVVREEGVNRFKDLVGIIVRAAASSGLSKKLEFITLIAVNDPDSIDKRAAHFHDATASVEHRGVRLLNGVLAICDRWRGGPIGSDTKIELALARVCALLTLSQYDLADKHLGHFRNGICGGKTFILGVSAYGSGDLKVFAQRIYLSIIRDALQNFLGKEQESIVGRLTDATYSEILSTVRDQIGGPAVDAETPEWANRKRRYESEIIPKLLDAVCSRVRREEEIIVTLEGLSARIRRGEPSSTVMAQSIYIGFPMATHRNWMIGIGFVAFVVLFVLVIAARKRWATNDRGTGKFPADVGSFFASRHEPIPTDPILADVLLDVISEIRVKLNHHTAFEPGDSSGHRTEHLLLGEQLLKLAKIDSAVPRNVGVKELRGGPGRMLLLALESGKWRTPEQCKELLRVQTDAFDAIQCCLRDEFLKWVWESEQPRLEDQRVVEQVLYSPPLSDRATIYSFCFVPRDWEIAGAPITFDRCLLNDSIHFMYLVNK